jgi:hypothetical protein
MHVVNHLMQLYSGHVVCIGIGTSDQSLARRHTHVNSLLPRFGALMRDFSILSLGGILHPLGHRVPHQL